VRVEISRAKLIPNDELERFDKIEEDINKSFVNLLEEVKNG